MIVNPTIRDLIIKGEDKKLSDAIRIGFLEGMVDFTENLRQLVERGDVTRRWHWKWRPTRTASRWRSRASRWRRRGFSNCPDLSTLGCDNRFWWAGGFARNWRSGGDRGWPGTSTGPADQVRVLERVRRAIGQEEAFPFTSLGRHRDRAVRLLELAGGHRRIENKLHGLRTSSSQGLVSGADQWRRPPPASAMPSWSCCTAAVSSRSPAGCGTWRRSREGRSKWLRDQSPRTFFERPRRSQCFTLHGL